MIDGFTKLSFENRQYKKHVEILDAHIAKLDLVVAAARQVVNGDAFNMGRDLDALREALRAID